MIICLIYSMEYSLAIHAAAAQGRKSFRYKARASLSINIKLKTQLKLAAEDWENVTLSFL